MKHVYDFPAKMTFTAYEGYASISVVDGRLELDAAPDWATLALIEKHGGVKVEEKPKKKSAKKRKVSSVKWSESEEINGSDNP